MQVLALEILMLWEDVREQRQQRYQFRLGLLGQDPDQVRRAFPDEFKTEVNADTADEEEIDRAIERELAGEASEWVTTGTPDQEEVTALLRRLSTGQGSISDMSTEEGWA